MSPFVLLNQVQVDEPCPKDWDEMQGDDRARFCTHCMKHVHNLSAMPAAEAEALLRDEGQLCVRYLQRPNGSIITADSTARRWRVLLHAGALATLLLVPGAQAATQPTAKKSTRTTTQQTSKPKRTVGAAPRAVRIQGKPVQKAPPAAAAPKMGEPAPIPPKPVAVLGDIATAAPPEPAKMILGKRAAQPLKP